MKEIFDALNSIMRKLEILELELKEISSSIRKILKEEDKKYFYYLEEDLFSEFYSFVEKKEER